MEIGSDCLCKIRRRKGRRKWISCPPSTLFWPCNQTWKPATTSRCICCKENSFCSSVVQGRTDYSTYIGFGLALPRRTYIRFRYKNPNRKPVWQQMAVGTWNPQLPSSQIFACFLYIPTLHRNLLTLIASFAQDFSRCPDNTCPNEVTIYTYQTSSA
jgi:hypothetical protein